MCVVWGGGWWWRWGVDVRRPQQLAFRELHLFWTKSISELLDKRKAIHFSLFYPAWILNIVPACKSQSKDNFPLKC